MSVITFEDSAGVRYTVQAVRGESVMQAAVAAGVPNIVAECGGSCACATCHCYVEYDGFPEPDELEMEMLDFVVDRRASSRLSCQLLVPDGMADVTIGLPDSQA